MTRINCHSAFRHYEMFHNNCCGGGSYGSIFNQTVNVNCGGHGGFWGGFGLGLGNAFGNIFGSFLGGGFGNFGFGGGFGNFGMGGFGFPSFGGFGGGWGNFWGGTPGISSSTTNSTCTCGCKDKNTSTSADKDEAVHKEFKKKINDLKSDDIDSAKKLYNEIQEKMKNNADDANPSISKDAYENLLRELKAKYPEIDAAESEGDEESEGAGAEQGTAGAGQGAAGAGQGTAGAGQGTTGAGQGATGAGQGAAGAGQGATGADDTVKIGGQDKKITDLTDTEIRGLTKDQIKNLKPEHATQLLKTLGIEQDGKVKASDLIDRAVIRLLAKAGINVKLAENKNTDGTITDNFIWGKIELDETQDDDSKPISYNVNCNNDKSTQKNTYTFTQTTAGAKEFTVKLKNPGSNVKLADNNQQTVIYKVENGEEYLTRNGKKYTTTH